MRSFLKNLFLNTIAISSCIGFFGVVRAEIECSMSNGAKLPFTAQAIFANQKAHLDDFVQCAMENITHPEIEPRDRVNDGLSMLAYVCERLGDPVVHLKPVATALLERVKDGSVPPANLNRMHWFVKRYAFNENEIIEATEKRWPSITINGWEELLKIRTAALTKNSVMLSDEFKKKLKKTQSGNHLLQNKLAVVRFISQHDEFLSKPYVQETLLKALEKEAEEVDAGNYVFWHSGDHGFDFCRDVYKELYKIDRPLESVDESYQFLRFDKGEKTKWAPRFFGPDVLYMNGALFGYSRGFIGENGGCSISFMNKSPTWSKERVHTLSSLQSLLSPFNLKHLSTKYEKDFERIKRLHAEMHGSGVNNLLLVAVNEENIDQVYSTSDFAGRCSINVGSGRLTAKAGEIVGALKAGTLCDTDSRYGSDFIQYALRLNKQYALNPHKGLKIHRFSPVDPVKKAEYEAAKAEFFGRLKEDVDSYKKELQAARSETRSHFL